MQGHSKFSIGILLFLMLWGGWSSPVYSQMPPNLKQFLESRSFPELISTYKRDRVSLITEGKRAKIIAAQPYRVEKGYRCQAFAGTQQENARRVAEQLRALQLDSVYVIYENSLYKVQIGNFDNRRDAEILLDKLRYSKVQGVWIVEADVHRPKSIEEQQAFQQQQLEEQQFEEQPGYYYAIQVFATNDQLKAAQLKEALARDLGQPVEAISQASSWKVLVGKFSNRSGAEEYLKKLKREKFADAWITQVPSP